MAIVIQIREAKPGQGAITASFTIKSEKRHPEDVKKELVAYFKRSEE